MPYDDRTAYRLVFDDNDDNGADMMTPGPGWCRALKVVRVEPDTGVRTSTTEGGLFRWDLLTKTTLMRLLLRSPFGVHSHQDTIGQDHDIHAPYYPRLESSHGTAIKFHFRRQLKPDLLCKCPGHRSQRVEETATKPW